MTTSLTRTIPPVSLLVLHELPIPDGVAPLPQCLLRSTSLLNEP
jgi:hypothetical protein